MKPLLLAGSVLACVFAALPAAATEIDCDNAVAQIELNQCAAAEYDEADAELNRVWKKAEAAARQKDADLDADQRGAQKALLAAQRGWIAYRDGACTLAGFDARGGSMEPMLVSGCLAEKTRERTKELQSFIDGPEQ